MARRPVLTKYPHLQHILKNDTVANQQFNACLDEVSKWRPKFDGSVANNERLVQQLSELHATHKELLEFSKKAKKLLARFGAVIEPQVHLKPYTEDIAEKNEYVIKFTAAQIRAVLVLHWEVVAHNTEDIIAGRAVDTEEE